MNLVPVDGLLLATLVAPQRGPLGDYVACGFVGTLCVPRSELYGSMLAVREYADPRSHTPTTPVA